MTAKAGRPSIGGTALVSNNLRSTTHLPPCAASVPGVRIARRALPFLLAALAACKAPSAPEETALDFWAAVVRGDVGGAARLADGDAAAVEATLAGFAPERSPAIGEATGSDADARVETVFLVGRPPAALRFDTRLVRRDGGWRVVLTETGASLTRARAAAR